MKFKKEEFKKNIKFLLSLFLIIIFFTIVSIFFKSENLLKNIDLANELDSNINKLVINEVCSSNGGIIIGEDGENYDWIELYNGSNKDIKLLNYSLSDKDNEVKWTFPDVTIKSKSYLVVFLSGNNISGLYANFSLRSGGGETLSLRNPSGKVIDAFKTEKIEKNNTFIRDANGTWYKTNKPTPEFENSEIGFSSYQKSLLFEESILRITEILPVNKGNFLDKNNLLSGYIELTNVSDKKVNIKDYFLSDSDVVPFKWKLPEKTLAPNEAIVIFTANISNSNDEFYADFSLNSKNGYAILSKNNGKVIDKVNYNNLANGHALIKHKKEFYETSNISPGFLNTSEGSSKFANQYLKAKSELIINEVMNLNSKYIPQNGGQYYDWIELKNNSNKIISLKDYYISNDIKDIKMYNLPDIKLKPNEFIILIASGDTNLSNNNYYHTNFKLSNNDGLYLIRDNDIIDSVFLYNIPANYSYGRGNISGFFYINNPTPGSDNSSGDREISYTPEALIPSGVFNDVEEIKIKIKAPGNIYYTLDGNTPTTDSNLYKDEIVLKKTSVLKLINYENGKRKSEVATYSYIINENHTLPVMSISLNENDYATVRNHPWEEDIEVPAYAELYEKNKSFSIPCGFKLFGGATRGLPKKSFSLKFKKQYGESELNYKVFENRESSRYNTLVIRSGSQDYARTMIRDELGASIVEGVTNLDVQAFKPIILYINGNYYGIYFLREKVDEEFVANHYNVDYKGTNIVRIDFNVTYGSASSYRDLLNYVSTHDLTKDEHYNYVASKIDIDSFIDFWVAEAWVTNNDIVNMRFFSNPNVEDGKWNYIFYDLDFAYYNEHVNYFTFMIDPSGIGNPSKYNNILVRKIMQNKKFRSRFVERLSYNLLNVWTIERINDKMKMLYDTLLPEMPRNQERWGLTMGTWESRLQELKDYINVRNSYLLKQTKSFFNLSDKEMQQYFGELL